VQVGTYKISGYTISLQAAVHPGASATRQPDKTKTRNKKKQAARIIRSLCRINNDFYNLSVGIMRDAVTRADVRDSGTLQHTGVF
jgi:hypothetical protein